MKCILSFFVLITLLIGQECHAQNFYVSPKGNDKNNGSIYKPFQSLERAKEKVKEYLSLNKSSSFQ